MQLQTGSSKKLFPVINFSAWHLYNNTLVMQGMRLISCILLYAHFRMYKLL